MPIAEIIKKLCEEAKLSEDEIKTLIQKKVDSHDGLVSEEGAAHIVAHDLNVELFKMPTETNAHLKIKDVVVGMQSFTLVGKVTQIFPIREFQKQGKKSQVGNFTLADKSGNTRIVLWDQKANIITEGKIKVGQVVKLKNGNVKSSNFSPSGKEIHLTIRSQLILDVDEKIEVKTPEASDGKGEIISAQIKDIAANQNVKIQGMIVRVFPPAFYDSCPQCGKKVVSGTGGYKCAEHGVVTAKPAMVLSVVLDDGTGTVRCTGFRQTAEKLSGISSEDAKTKAENPVLIQEEMDNILLGNEIEIQGFVRENKAFDRTEITINNLNTTLNPIEIAKSLMKK